MPKTTLHQCLTRCIIILTVAFTLSACSGTRPAYLGVAQSELTKCPTTPNCVSSHPDEDEEHSIEAFSVSDPNSAYKTLSQSITENPSAKIIVNTPSYIYAEYKSDLMGFVDDVELLFKPNRIEVRSASRLGYSDWGVNRERIEALRNTLTEE